MSTLLISLGGGTYQNAPALCHAAFARSSRALAETLLWGNNALLLAEAHLDLFDDDRAWPEQLIAIRDWLRAKLGSAEAGGGEHIENVLVHHVGHGMFKPNSEEHYLSINATDAEDRAMTSASLGQLNDILIKNARQQRRIYLIDACFAAASIRDLMGPPEEAIEVKVGGILGAWPDSTWGKSGVAALCSADKMATASARGERQLTQFTDGLLTVLEKGDAESDAPLSMRKVHRMLCQSLNERYGDEAVHPVLVAPVDKDGGIAEAPIFANAHKQIHPKSLSRVLPVVGQSTSADQAEVRRASEAKSEEEMPCEAAGTTKLVTGFQSPVDKGMEPDNRVDPADWCLAASTSTLGMEANLLSAEQRFRQAAYRFFRLPHSKKDEIARTFASADGATLPDLERYKAMLAIARDTNSVEQLEKMIVRAEREQ
jgi:hypothetical protein